MVEESLMKPEHFILPTTFTVIEIKPAQFFWHTPKSQIPTWHNSEIQSSISNKHLFAVKSWGSILHGATGRRRTELYNALEMDPFCNLIKQHALPHLGLHRPGCVNLPPQTRLWKIKLQEQRYQALNSTLS